MNLRRTFLLITTGVLLNCAVGLAADEIPNIGLLWNTKEAHSLVYHCNQESGTSLLNCDFTQTTIRKKALPDELGAKLTKAREEFRGEMKISAEECKAWEASLDVLEGRKTPPDEEGFRELTDMQRKDFLSLLRAVSQFCRLRTEESYLQIVTLGHDKDMRTCVATSNVFKQTFTYVRDRLSESGAWVTQGNPEGPCGIVQLCRFEPERSKDSKSTLWKYIARKAITNPQGSFFPGASCKGLDEGEYLFDWRSKEHSLGCDYIEFSVF